jgi:ribosomal protein L11 methyltransferase
MNESIWKWKITVYTKDQPLYVCALSEVGAAVSYGVDSKKNETVLEITLPIRDIKNCDQNQAQARINQFLIDFNLPDPLFSDLEKLPEKDWLAENRQSFPPIDVGTFFIHGSHYEGLIPQNKHVLKIDAALAFGSGEHASTKGCLLALDFLYNKNIKKAIDIGCGSGILSMAIVKLFEIPVLGIDIDPFSVTTATENAKDNKVDKFIKVIEGTGYDPLKSDDYYDLIMANILAGPLCDMAEDLARHLQKGGYAVLSGLLEEQEEQVVQAHTKHGLKVIEIFHLDGWSTIILSKDV